jgi:exopolysaccharide biosynthesis polyprenyl glycosylphosphotransferase
VNLVGFVDWNGRVDSQELDNVPLVGSPERLRDLVEMLQIDRVVIAFPAEPHETLIDQVRSLADLHVHIDIVPRLVDAMSPNVDVHSVEGLPLIGLPRAVLTPSQRRMKRAMDVVLSFIGLVVFAPFFVLFAILIKLDSPGPVLFRQVRMGASEKPFRMLKFRTMVCEADARKAELAPLNQHAVRGDGRMFKIADDPRVTRLGRFLRRYSLDELPQLLNVLRGEMTLVGPRPLILDEDQHVEHWARRRLDLKPGMTGLWQVLGASEIPFEEMTKLDYLYVTNWSLREDIRLIMLTLPALTRARAAY